MCHECENERDHESDSHSDGRQLDVLDERGPEHVVPVIADPVLAERVVALHAVAAFAEVRDDGAAVVYSTPPASARRNAPSSRPSSPTTTTSSAPVSIICETALRSDVAAGSRG